MPEGVLQWLDPTEGSGRVLGLGVECTVDVHDVDPGARFPGARVRFDLVHDASGDVAVDVVLSERVRAVPTQRRFGDLLGARSPERTIGRERTGTIANGDRRGRPRDVAERWAAHVAGGNADGAARLYAPAAVLQIEGDLAMGRAAIRTEMCFLPVFGSGRRPEVVDDHGDVVRVRWPALTTHCDAIESHLVIAEGEIVEHWQGEVLTVVDATGGFGTIDLCVEGDVPASARTQAVEGVTRATSTMSQQVRHVSVRLEVLANPTCERRSRARAALDIDGDLVQARVSAETMTEAVDLLEQRLVARVRDRTSGTPPVHRRRPSTRTGGWCLGGCGPSDRSRPARLDSNERTTVRRPTWSSEPCTFDEAVHDLEALDLEFLLFTDLASGQDAVVFRHADGEYGIRLSEVVIHGQRTACFATVMFDSRPTPRISIDEARQLLDDEYGGWLFFTDLATQRGHVMFHRDDGHDGLMTPRSPLSTTANVPADRDELDETLRTGHVRGSHHLSRR